MEDAWGDEEFRSLMTQVRAGSEEAARQLVADYSEPMLHAVRRMLNGAPWLRSEFESVEFVQIAWEKFFQMKTELDGIETRRQLVELLLRIVANQVGAERRRFRSKRCGCRLVSLDDPAAQAVFEPCASPEELASLREQLDHVLEKRPKKHRRMVELRSEGYSCEQIAGVVGCSVAHVRRVVKDIQREVLR